MTSFQKGALHFLYQVGSGISHDLSRKNNNVG